MDRVGFVDYSRQADMDRFIQDRSGINFERTRVVIIGCGGIGIWLGLHAALLGFTHFTLFDRDAVDSSNLNRLPVDQRWIGKPKVLALKAIIRGVRPDTVILATRKHFNPDTDLNVLERTRANCNKTLVFDCTDNAIVQKKIFKLIHPVYNHNYIKVGYEGFDVGAYDNYDIWIDNEEEYETGYRTSSANSMSSSFAAIIGLLKALSGQYGDININMLSMIGVANEQLG